MAPKTPPLEQQLTVDICRAYVNSKIREGASGRKKNYKLTRVVLHGYPTHNDAGTTISKDLLGPLISNLSPFTKIPIIEARWMNPKYEEMITSTVMVGFEDDKGKVLPTLLSIKPNTVYADGYSVTFKEYINADSITICAKCHRYGHLASACKGKETCLFCAGLTHRSDEHYTVCGCGPCLAARRESAEPKERSRLMHSCERKVCTACSSIGHYTLSDFSVFFCSSRDSHIKRIDSKIPDKFRHLKLGNKDRRTSDGTKGKGAFDVVDNIDDMYATDEEMRGHS
jgi:hypothetical protein